MYPQTKVASGSALEQALDAAGGISNRTTSTVTPSATLTETGVVYDSYGVTNKARVFSAMTCNNSYSMNLDIPTMPQVFRKARFALLANAMMVSFSFIQTADSYAAMQQ